MRKEKDINSQLALSIECEESILGCLLLDSKSFARLPQAFNSESFYVKAHQIIFMAIVEAINHDKCDLLGVSQLLAHQNQLDAIGGTAKLGQLLNRTVSATNIDRYAEIIIDQQIKRKLVSYGNDVAEWAGERTEKPEDVLEKAQRELSKIVLTKETVTFKDSADLLIDWQQQAEEIEANEGVMGVTSKFPDLHEHVEGFGKGHLVIIAARPSVGKTSFALNLARDILAQDIPTLFFSLEMRAVEIGNRLLSNTFNIPLSNINRCKFTPVESEAIYGGLERFSAMPFHVLDNTAVSITGIKTLVKMKQFELDKPIGAIFVDYLQLMGNDTKHRTEEIGFISRQLKILAQEIDCPVFCLSQLNRSSTTRNDRKPNMADLRDSGEIEQNADVVIMLHRDDVAFPERPPNGEANIMITKNRHGSIGEVKMRYHAPTTRFISSYRTNNA